MNLPQYQPDRIDVPHFQAVAAQYGIFYTIHLDENLNVSDFNPYIAEGYRRTVTETIALAKAQSCRVVLETKTVAGLRQSVTWARQKGWL